DLPFYTVGSLRGHGTSNIANHYKFKDRNLKSGKYLYRLKQVDYNSNFIFHLLTDEILIGIPDKLTLSQNYPNPFNPSTKINFQLPEDGFVNISVYDPAGKQIINLINESRVAGYQTFEIDGSLLSSGVYYYRLIFESSGNIRSYTRKMMLIK
ncbi:MAG: T9SS type A sorting domain-containing protein, partial [Ignavibacteria bacterium]